MDFGFGFEKLLVIGVLAIFVVGPERLPTYAATLGRWVRMARTMLDDAKSRVKDELGDDFDEEQWRKLDPRQYDPRRIIRDALLEPSETPRAERNSAPTPAAPRAAAKPAPLTWDEEAT